MTSHLFTVTFPKVSGIPADSVVNTFSIDGPASMSQTEFDRLGVAIENFYDATAHPTARSVSSFMSSRLSRSTLAVEVLAYKRPAAPGPLGSPIHGGHFTLSAANVAQPLPDEVSIVASFHASLTNIAEESAGPPPTRPAARRRGRLFIGPLSVEAMEGSAGTIDQVPSTVLMGVLADAMKDFEVECRVGGLSAWQVFSQSDWVGRDVVGGHVDNAFDIQRRRGIDATTRTTWTI